jgi:hypothetical protein
VKEPDAMLLPVLPAVLGKYMAHWFATPVAPTPLNAVLGSVHMRLMMYDTLLPAESVLLPDASFATTALVQVAAALQSGSVPGADEK